MLWQPATRARLSERLLSNMEFRELRRFKQAATPQECEAVLSSARRGILAVHGENGYPYGLPVNYLYLDGKIYFHCAK